MSLKSLIFTDDKQQAIRIQRFLVSMIAYGLSFGLAYLTYDLGYLDTWSIGYGGLVVVGIFVGFYFWFRTGLNLRMPDPSLTTMQMVVATLVIMFLMYNVTYVRGHFLIIYSVVLLFGIYGLTTRQFLGVSVFVLATYAFVIYMLRHHHPERISISHDMLQWIALAVLLPFFAIIGGHISSLRSRLRSSHTEVKKAMDVIHEMAIRDELTALYNRRHFMEMLNTEKARANRHGQLFCVLMLDTHHFKKVNDTLGHLAGDQVIRAVAASIRAELRAFDFCGRFGGEEFVLVLGQATREGALPCAERIRRHVAELTFPDLPEGFRVTVSVGVTEYALREDVEATIARADEALYRAKNGGRDRVEFG